MRRRKPLLFFAICAPGLEKPAWAELRDLGIRTARYEAGGVAFAGDWETAYLANLWSRLAGRVLWRAASFPATTLAALHRGARRVAWDEFVGRAAPIDIHAAAHGSRLRIKQRLTETVAAAMAERLGFAPVPAADGLRIFVRLTDDQCELSVDASGELLHRRGYRQETAHAPLRETLAAGILRLAEYDPQRPLVDPLCGSGVFAAEAAWIALRRAPGRARSFAFQRFASFQPGAWARLCAEADQAVLAALPAPIMASDISAHAVDAARGNLARAGLGKLISVAEADFAALAPKAAADAGLIVMNPPYGGRVGAGESLPDLYGRLGDALRRRWRGWRLAVLFENEALFRRMLWREDARYSLIHGGKRTTLAVGRIQP